MVRFVNAGAKKFGLDLLAARLLSITCRKLKSFIFFPIMI